MIIYKCKLCKCYYEDKGISCCKQYIRGIPPHIMLKYSKCKGFMQRTYSEPISGK